MNTSQRCSGIETHPPAQTKRRGRPRGLILYEGPSQLDAQKPIVVVATGLIRPSVNAKTGPMVQTWILNRDLPPQTAAKSGDDHAVCGDCKLRGDGRQRACYVTLRHGPRSVWNAYQRNYYHHVDQVLVVL